MKQPKSTIIENDLKVVGKSGSSERVLLVLFRLLLRSNLFKNITVEDAEWIAGRLSQLSDRQIEDAFRAANYSPEEIRKLTQGLHERIKELVELPKVLTAKMRITSTSHF